MVLGLHLMGVWRIGWLETDRRIQLNQKAGARAGCADHRHGLRRRVEPLHRPLAGVGLDFGRQSRYRHARGIGLLTLYSTGLAIPFILLSVGIHYLIRFVRRANKALRYVNIGAGVLLVLTGLLLVTDKLYMLSYFSI
jgi:cytochrome c-type biogenesis protein